MTYAGVGRHGPATVEKRRSSEHPRGFDPALAAHPTRVLRIEEVVDLLELTHAPEVIREIERTVRAAAPFPVPARMQRVTYTDTWLWDKSGHFQLDTLTEGQL